MKIARVSLLRILITGLTVLIISCEQSDRITLGYNYAKSELNEALRDSLGNQILTDTLITNQESAVNIAESILFNIYQKDNIIKQRPYEINLIDGYWVINGTIPKGSAGGTFLIIINSRDGKVIKMTHGK